jgi:hypothetical protein
MGTMGIIRVKGVIDIIIISFIRVIQPIINAGTILVIEVINMSTM